MIKELIDKIEETIETRRCLLLEVEVQEDLTILFNCCGETIK